MISYLYTYRDSSELHSKNTTNQITFYVKQNINNNSLLLQFNSDSMSYKIIEKLHIISYKELEELDYKIIRISDYD